MAAATIYLRPLEPGDIDDRYLSWFWDADVTRFLEARNLSREAAHAYLDEAIQTGIRHLYAICDAKTDLHIGNVKIGDIDRKAMTSDLVTVIGDRNYWGKGLATEAIRQGNTIAFRDLGIRKLHGGMYASNIGSIKAYCRAGWVIEAVLHGHYELDGKIMDRVVVSCFNPDLFPELPEFPKPFPEF